MEAIMSYKVMLIEFSVLNTHKNKEITCLLLQVGTGKFFSGILEPKNLFTVFQEPIVMVIVLMFLTVFY